MKKIIASTLIAVMVLASVAPVAQAKGEESRGGFMGFIAGCCFGVRAGADYNDGKEIVWREWVMLVPYVNIVFMIWNGIDGSKGVTRADYAEKYGSVYF